MTTDKQQPPTPPEQIDVDTVLQSIVETPAGERIRMTCGAADLRSVITDILEYARVHPVDDARVAEIREQMLQRRSALERDGDDYCIGPSALDDIDYLLSLLPQLSCSEPLKDSIPFTALLSVLKRLRSKNKNPNREWYEGWNAAIDCLIRDAEACLKTPTSTVSSSERRCGECHHNGSLKNGICQEIVRLEPVTNAQLDAMHQEFRGEAGVIRCNCKCVFPVTSAADRDAAITLLRELRTTDPEEVARQKESWATLQSDLRSASAGEGGQRESWLPYVHEDCPREVPVWLAFPSGNVSLNTLTTKPFFWYEDDPTHYMIATLPPPPAATANAAAASPVPVAKGERFNHHPTCSRRGGTSCTCRTSTSSEAAREAAQKIAQWLGLTGCVDGEAINEVAAIISKHYAAEAGEVERLRSIEMLYNAGLKTWNPVYEQILNERNRLHADLAGVRANTINECIEKLNALSTLPFDAVPYIRRDDAVAALESLAENSD